MKNILVTNHFSGKVLDDTFSQIVYDRFLQALDPDRLYLTQKDILSLATYQNRIDDELNGGSFDFLPTVTQLFKKSLERSETMILQVSQIPVEFKTKEGITS